MYCGCGVVCDLRRNFLLLLLLLPNYSSILHLFGSNRQNNTTYNYTMCSSTRSWFAAFMTLFLLLLPCSSIADVEPSTRADDVPVFSLRVIFTATTRSQQLPVRYNTMCSAEVLQQDPSQCTGGAARRATIIGRLRDEAENVLLMDGGWTFHGSLFWETFSGQDSKQVFDELEYDVVGLKKSEFYSGLDDLESFLRGSRFRAVVTNLDVSREPQLRDLVDRYFVKSFPNSEERVAVLNLMSQDALEHITPAYTRNLNVSREADTLRSAIGELTAQGIDKVLLIGLGNDTALLRAANGVDADFVPFVLYSNSATLSAPQGPAPFYAASPWDQLAVPVIGPGTNGMYVSYMDLGFDALGYVVQSSGDTILLDSSVPDDPTVALLVTAMSQQVDAFTKEVVGSIDGALAGPDGVDIECRTGECALGDLVTDILRQFTESDFAMYNGGGLQEDLEGEVTVGDVQLALPFADTVSVVLLSGHALVLALENGFSEYVAPQDVDSSRGLDGRFVQLSGLHVWWNPSLRSGARVVRVAWSNGDALDLNREYSLALGSYIRFGGDGYDVFLSNATGIYTAGPTISELLTTYLGENSPYTPVKTPSRQFQSNELPILGKTVVYISTDSAAAISSYVLGAVGVLACTLTAALMYRHREAQVVKYSSPLFLYLILTGLVFAYVSLFILPGKPNSARCIIYPYFPLVSVALIYACVIAKNFRIWKIFHGPVTRVRTGKLKTKFLLLFVGLVLSVLLVMCILWSAIDPSQPTLHDDNFDDSKITLRCSSNNSLVWFVLLCCVLAAVLVPAVVLAVLTRKVDSLFKESVWIGWSVYTNAVLVSATLAVALGLLGSPVAQFLGIIVGTFACASCTLCLLFLPKLYTLYAEGGRRETGKLRAGHFMKDHRSSAHSDSDLSLGGSTAGEYVDASLSEPASSQSHSRKGASSKGAVLAATAAGDGTLDTARTLEVPLLADYE
mmetsp:Transcript_1633/g.5051  ORF Transcript_1633/g.5051 Transcript_1633/m.5051 type:complete len:963 (+) Transcript_1633:98-2986(+)